MTVGSSSDARRAELEKLRRIEAALHEAERSLYARALRRMSDDLGDDESNRPAGGEPACGASTGSASA